MKVLLLDTNVVVYLSKDIRYGELYRRHVANARCLISFMTAAELYEGVFRAGIGSKKSREIVAEISRYGIIPCGEEICRIFGRIRAASRNKPISVPDALIAATALAYELPLVTHNAEHFKGIAGLNVITEYREKT